MTPPVAATLVSTEGETLDAVLHRAGQGPEALVSALDLNPALAGTVILPPGTLVRIPAPPVQTFARPITQLWS